MVMPKVLFLVIVCYKSLVCLKLVVRKTSKQAKLLRNYKINILLQISTFKKHTYCRDLSMVIGMLFKKYTAYHSGGGFTLKNGVVLARKRPLSRDVRMLYYNILFQPKSGVQLGATRFFRPSKVAKSSTYGHLQPFYTSGASINQVGGYYHQGTITLEVSSFFQKSLDIGKISKVI